jgi:Mg-chelatase subunit ChlD
MNSDSPHSQREELEARLTALLLGELSAAEATTVRHAIEQDAELAQLYERLERTINLVQEAAASPIEHAAEPSTVLKLSEENRQRLLQSFKTATPKEFTAPRRREMPWFIPMSIAAVAVALIGSVALLPGFWSQFTDAKIPTTLVALSRHDSAQLSDSETRQDLSFQKDIARPKNAKGVSLAHEQSASGVISRPASDVASATPAFGGIVLPFAGDSANSPEGTVTVTVTPEVASKASPESRFGRDGGGGGGGGIGGAGFGGGGRPGDSANFSYWRADPTVTAASPDNGRKVPDFATPAGAPKEPPRIDSLGTNNGEISKSEQNTFAFSLIGDPKPIGVLGVPEAEDIAGTLGAAPISAIPSVTTIDPTTGLPISAQTMRLNENLKQQAHADGALALGETPALGDLFQATKNIAAGAEANAPIPRSLASQTPAKDTFGDSDRNGKIDSLQAGVAGRSAGAATGKIGAQGGTVPLVSTIPSQVGDRRPFTVPLRDSGVVTAFSEAEGLTRGLAVPLAQGPQKTQLAQLQDKNRIHPTPSPSKGPSLQKDEKLSEIDVLELQKRPDVNGEQSILANRGEQDSAAPKMDSRMMRRYGLKMPSGAEPKAKAAANAGEKTQSLQQSIVLPQKPSDEVENRPLRESARNAKVTAAPETLLTLKRELERSVPSRSYLRMKPNAGKEDATLPKSGTVQIVELAQAEPEKSPSLVERLRRTVTGGIEKVARIQVPKDASDVDTMGGKGPGAFDPFFIQTEFEVIQSASVLSKVIEKLGLNEAWAKKYGTGEKLKEEQTRALLRRNLAVRQLRDTSLIEIHVKSDNPDEAARIANTIAEVYRDLRLKQEIARQDKKIVSVQQKLEPLQDSNIPPADSAPPKPAGPAPIPQPEIQTGENAFSTFSLNVSDVSFKLAAASLEKGVMPEPATVRSEEFINAFDYRDSEPPPAVPIAFAWERTRYPFAHNRDLLRFSIKTAAEGRQSGRPLNLVLLLDNSGSMERADRVRIVHEALGVLAGQLQPQDKLSVIAFARAARLWADGVPGNQAGEVAEQVSTLTPQGGTNLEEAMNLAYQTALRHYVQGGVNRVVLLTDGAANLGNVSPAALTQKVETHRKQGIALDCFGIGWEGYNDDLLEVLSRHGDGRYGFINTPEEASTGFAGQLAGALRVAASDVKLQVEFNPKRVTAYRQIGYAKHQLTQEQFRDNTVDAAEIGAAESGNALYVVEVNPRGEGQLAVVRVRFKVPGTAEYREQEWIVPYTGSAVPLEQASSAMRLAASASAFSEWLGSSPYAAEVTPDRLLGYLNGVLEAYGIDPRPKQLESMIRQAKSLVVR